MENDTYNELNISGSIEYSSILNLIQTNKDKTFSFRVITSPEMIQKILENSNEWSAGELYRVEVFNTYLTDTTLHRETIDVNNTKKWILKISTPTYDDDKDEYVSVHSCQEINDEKSILDHLIKNDIIENGTLSLARAICNEELVCLGVLTCSRYYSEKKINMKLDFVGGYSIPNSSYWISSILYIRIHPSSNKDDLEHILKYTTRDIPIFNKYTRNIIWPNDETYHAYAQFLDLEGIAESIKDKIDNSDDDVTASSSDAEDEYSDDEEEEFVSSTKRQRTS